MQKAGNNSSVKSCVSSYSILAVPVSLITRLLVLVKAVVVYIYCMLIQIS